MNNKKRGKYLVSLRKRKGITQLELAELLHYSDKNISKWENGKSFPNDPNILNDIAYIFDVPVENIIYGEDNALDKINELTLKKFNSNLIKSYFLIILFLIFILLFIFYKFDNYYVASIENNNLNESKIFIILHSEYNRFKIKKLKPVNKEIDLVSFYYEKDNHKYLLFETENDDFVITEYSYYLEYDFTTIVDKTCYLKILYDDGSDEIIKINFNKYLSYLFT